MRHNILLAVYLAAQTEHCWTEQVQMPAVQIVVRPKSCEPEYFENDRKRAEISAQVPSGRKFDVDTSAEIYVIRLVQGGLEKTGQRSASAALLRLKVIGQKSSLKEAVEAARQAVRNHFAANSKLQRNDKPPPERLRQKQKFMVPH